ncbi:hypothetical protein MCEORH2_01706 [Methylophilaceae bacterium]
MAVYAYSQGEPVLAGAFLLGLIPSVGLLITALNVVILLFKGWYGSAAIIGGLIAFNLLGNFYMTKKLAVSDEESKGPKRGVVESLILTIGIMLIPVVILAILYSNEQAAKSPASILAIEEPQPAEPAPNPPSGIDWSSAPVASSEPPPPVTVEVPHAPIGVKKITSNRYLLKFAPEEYQAAPTLRELEAINQRHQPQVDDPSSLAKKKFRRNVASSHGCESGHWVDSVSDDGDIVKLEDGSVWEIAAADTVDSMLWLPTTDIIACDDKLINTEDNETVEAVRLK